MKPGKCVTTVVIYYSYASYIGNTDSDTDIQCFELVILRQGDCTETRPSRATLNLLNRRHPVSRRLRATDHWVNQRPRVHKPSVSTEACKLFNIFHKLAPGEDRTRVTPKSDACPYHPDRGGVCNNQLSDIHILLLCIFKKVINILYCITHTIITCKQLCILVYLIKS